MTLAELQRAIKSKKRIEKERAKEKAGYDYILADLIGKSISRLYSSTAKIPRIEEVYPNLFDMEEIQEKKQERQNELNVARFRQFAECHNSKFK